MGKKLIIKGADFSANGIAPEFQILKCIVSTAATQVIQSPISFTPRSRVVAEIGVSNNNTNGHILGFGSNTTNNPEDQFYFDTIHDVPSYFSGGFGMIGYINKKGAQAVSDVINDLQKHTIDASRYVLKVDNSQISIQETTAQNSVNFGIFGDVNYLDRKNILVGLKLYSFKMYSDYENLNSLVLDCIPVKRLSDDKICLYDKINGEYLFTVDGTNPDYETLYN